MLTSEQRRELAELKRKVKAIQAPEWLERRKARKAEKRAHDKALSRTEGQRDPRIHDAVYLNFIRAQPCMICGAPPRSEAAHVRAGYPEARWSHTGKAEKPHDRRTLPLCRLCHRDGPKAQHRANERAWWKAHGIYPPSACTALEAQYEDGSQAHLPSDGEVQRSETTALNNIGRDK